MHEAAANSSRYPPWRSSIGPAPGDLRIVQAFVNTRDIAAEADELGTAAGLRRWLRRWRLIGRSDRVAEAERRQAIDLREGLRELLLANAGELRSSGRAGSSSKERLERALADLPIRCALAEAGSFELLSVRGGWPRAAARMLTAVIRSMGEGTWVRLKACSRAGCQWAFYDGSKNRSGRWCSMAGCGDLMKARAYRRRLQSKAGERVRRKR